MSIGQRISEDLIVQQGGDPDFLQVTMTTGKNNTCTVILTPSQVIDLKALCEEFLADRAKWKQFHCANEARDQGNCEEQCTSCKIVR